LARNVKGGVLYKERARVWLPLPAYVASGGMPPVLVEPCALSDKDLAPWLIEAWQRAARSLYSKGGPGE